MIVISDTTPIISLLNHKDPYKGLTYADALVIKLVKG